MSDKKNEKLLREAQPVVVPMQYVVFAPPGAGFISIFPGMFAFVCAGDVSTLPQTF